MTIIVTDTGFSPDTFNGPWTDLPPDADDSALSWAVARQHPVRIQFPAFSDGRGFTLAARLRRMGFTGRLRAQGHVIADQYAMARRSGFDEVEISDDLAARQPEAQWLSRANWRAHDYRHGLRRSG
ncbi:DUF934 domain-containing protein [Roseinatronobacter sp. NSM]|uniref:DUF934 domain-containing protein n=1 Tax=Roseinatronobacter sp. NSM TaxID=3457785 RepID=UPI004035B6B3